MRNTTLLVLSLWFIPLYCISQQVLSDDALLTKRNINISARSSVVFLPYSCVLPTFVNTLATPPTSFVAPPPQVVKHSGPMAADVSIPFASYSQPTIGKRYEWGFTDPGQIDMSSPIGNEMILILFTSFVALLKSIRDYD